MHIFLIVVHVIVSIFLIVVILFQAGRGGGLADTFGGSQLQSLFGTKSASILTRLTTICAAVFILTCLSIAIISSHRARSLVEKVDIPMREGVLPISEQALPPVSGETLPLASEEAPVPLSEEVLPPISEEAPLSVSEEALPPIPEEN